MFFVVDLCLGCLLGMVGYVGFDVCLIVCSWFNSLVCFA